MFKASLCKFLFLLLILITTPSCSSRVSQGVSLDFRVGTTVWSEVSGDQLTPQTHVSSRLKQAVRSQLSDRFTFSLAAAAEEIDSVNFFTALDSEGKPLDRAATLRFEGPLGEYDEAADFQAGQFWDTQPFMPYQAPGKYTVTASVGGSEVTANANLDENSLLPLPIVYEIEVVEDGFISRFKTEGAKSHLAMLYARSVGDIVWVSDGVTGADAGAYVTGPGITLDRVSDLDLVVFAFGWDVTGHVSAPFYDDEVTFNISVRVQPLAAPFLESLAPFPLALSAAPGETAQGVINLDNIGLSALEYEVSVNGSEAISVPAPTGTIFPDETRPLIIEGKCTADGQRETAEITISTNEVGNDTHTSEIRLECFPPLVLTPLWEAELGSRPHFSPSSDLIVVSSPLRVGGGSEWHMRILDSETGNVLREFPIHDEQVQQLAWHPSATMILSSAKFSQAKLWNTETGEVLRELTLEPPASGFFVGFSPDGSRLAFSNGIELLIQDVISGETYLEITLPNRSSQAGLAWSPDGQLFAAHFSTPDGGGIHFIDAETGEIVRSLSLDCDAYLLSWSPDGRHMFLEGCRHPELDNRVPVILYVDTGDFVLVLDANIDVFGDHPWHPRGNMFAAEKCSDEVAIYSAFTGEKISTLSESCITHSSWSSQGDLLVVDHEQLYSNTQIVYSIQGGP